MRFHHYGPSWGFGALCAMIFFGHLSAWWLLTAPLFLIECDWLRLKWPGGE